MLIPHILAMADSTTLSVGEGSNQESGVLSSPHLHGGNSRREVLDAEESTEDLCLKVI